MMKLTRERNLSESKDRELEFGQHIMLGVQNVYY